MLVSHVTPHAFKYLLLCINKQILSINFCCFLFNHYLLDYGNLIRVFKGALHSVIVRKNFVLIYLTSNRVKEQSYTVSFSTTSLSIWRGKDLFVLRQKGVFFYNLFSFCSVMVLHKKKLA